MSAKPKRWRDLTREERGDFIRIARLRKQFEFGPMTSANAGVASDAPHLGLDWMKSTNFFPVRRPR